MPLRIRLRTEMWPRPSTSGTNKRFEDEFLCALTLLWKGQDHQLIHRPPKTVVFCAPTNKVVQTLLSSFVRDGWTKNELVVVGSQHTVLPEILEYCLTTASTVFAS